jgi:hypothetical protein
MRVLPLLALVLGGLAPAGAFASGNGDDVMVLAGSRVTTWRGAFVAQDAARETGVVVLRGAEVGGAIPDPSSVDRERRPFLPPTSPETDARPTPVQVRIVVPAGPTHAIWLPSERGRRYWIRTHPGHPEHPDKPWGPKVAAAPPLWVSPTYGAPHSPRRGVGRRGGSAARPASGHGARGKH